MTGQNISHYRVLEKLGEGGMGVVYRAEDTKLERAVALKFLPPHLLGNEDVRKRFEREAKAAASLHHANICPVHEIDEAEGKAFISMALIEGESLDKKIAQGPLKLNDALDIAQQIAKGLEAAHKKGIFHRDIKPENIMVGDDAHVTIMDFGLAQLTEASRLTKKDETLGTIYYMSPEQAEGSGTDHRTDIWALGVVIYEMVTGQHPFKGDYDRAILYSVLNEAPEPMTALRTGVPMELEVTVNKALAKQASERYQNTGELVVDLRGVQRKFESGRSTIAVTRQIQSGSAPEARSPWLLVAAGALITAAVVSGLWYAAKPSPQPGRVVRFSIDLPERSPAVISPDGRLLAYGQPDGIWIRDLARETPYLLEGTKGTRPGGWSPDSRQLLFVEAGKLRKLDVAGGPSAVVCDLPHNDVRALSWSDAGDEIVFSSADSTEWTRLYVVSALGGEPRLLFEPPEDQHETGYNGPVFLPGRRAFLVSEHRHGAEVTNRIKVYDLDADELQDVGDGASPVYSASGHLVFSRDQVLWAAAFSLDSLKMVGEPFGVSENAAWTSVSNDGTMVWMDLPSRTGRERLVWRDRAGKEIGQAGQESGDMRYPRISPDGSRIVVRAMEGKEQDLWIHEVDRPIRTRLTRSEGKGRHTTPVWTPGGQILYGGFAESTRAVYRIADTGGSPTRVGSGEVGFIQDVSRDGAVLLYGEPEKGIWSSRFEHGEVVEEGIPFATDGFHEHAARLSPDGRYVAYVSDESGEAEVYIKPLAGPGRKVRVSPKGGVEPIWRGDGKELFYVQGSTMMAVQTTLGDEVSVGAPVALFENDWVHGHVNAEYDVSADGSRFIIPEPVGEHEETSKRLWVTLNWFEEFRESRDR